MLKIDRKAHTRKATAKRKGTLVKRTVYIAKDRGKPGRGPTLIKIKKPGSLGVSFDDTAEVRRKKEALLAKKVGEKSVQGKLQAIATFDKRTNPEVAKKAAADKHWVASNFIGKTKVKSGKGLS